MITASTSRGPGVLLQYYARHLAGDWARSPSLARAERLKLDIVPSLEGKQLRLAVLYQNQPVAGGEVVIVDPAGEVHELATDDKGRVDIVASAGRFAIRAAHKEASARASATANRMARRGTTPR